MAIPIQQFIEVDEIKEGVMILKNKSMRAVLMCTSVNFELKSGDEQEATLYQFQNFLNSLDFHLQFLVRSRKLDLTGYLDSMRERSKSESNELMRIQTDEYVEFVKSLIELQNIMSKTFYTVVPLDFAIAEDAGGFFGNLFKGGPGKKYASKEVDPAVAKDEGFDRNKNQLMQRVNHVVGGLSAVGIRAATLGDEELQELLFSAYNPGEGAMVK